MTFTASATRSATVAITETRVRAVLRQLNVDLYAAAAAELVDRSRTDGWYDDLSYMLLKNALSYFELRVVDDAEVVAAWRYVVSSDGSLTQTDQGGGINFYAFSRTASVRLVIQRRTGLPKAVSAEIDRRGWTNKVASLGGAMTQERTYSKDGYGVVRHSLQIK